MGDNSLVNLGELSKPATVLIEKVSDAVGGICKPWQTIRVAKAERKAGLIRADGEIEITELHQRAAQRWLEEETKRQENIESITAIAIDRLEEESDPSKVSDDWVANFFDKSRIVSDAEMQQLWGGLLAQEANSPGRVSRKTVNILADLNKEDATLFSSLCRYGWKLSDRLVPVVFDHDARIYNDNNIDFENLTHLNSLGLIQFESIEGFSISTSEGTIDSSYNNKTITISSLKGNDGLYGLDVGLVMLSRAGNQLYNLCEPNPVEGFYEYCVDSWSRAGFVSSDHP